MNRSDDLISREVILKHIEKIRQGALMMDDIRRASIIMLGMDLGEEAVRNQPSAQPEIIKCEDCMHNGSFDTDCPIDWAGKEYCNFAERLEVGGQRR